MVPIIVYLPQGTPPKRICGCLPKYKNSTRRPIPHGTKAILPASTTSTMLSTSGQSWTDRQLMEGIIAKVHEHTELVNSIVQEPKPDGMIRLYLDPKDLSKAIKRNQW